MNATSLNAATPPDAVKQSLVTIDSQKQNQPQSQQQKQSRQSVGMSLAPPTMDDLTPIRKARRSAVSDKDGLGGNGGSFVRLMHGGEVG